MINELRIHGSIGPVEFYTYISGSDVSKTIFYEDTPSHVRFFSKGNEFILTHDNIRYRGSGGSFCEYMFGVDKPMDDTLRKEIVNRLIMFGAYPDKGERLIFTDNIEGSETFYRLFLQGHAVKNYYFLVSSDYKGGYKKRQKEILKAIGKYLKRTQLVDDADDAQLIRAFIDGLDDGKSTVFIFKLIHKNNNEFYSAFRNFYSEERFLDPNKKMFLDDLIAKNNIDEYQVERIKIDVMYKHTENKTVVDEYRDILIDACGRDNFRPAEVARLRRLRTLAIRNNIPGTLFDTLDHQLLKDKKIHEEHEPAYLKEARGIFENLFFKDPNLKKHIIKEDIVRLLNAKHLAHEKSDMGFEQIVLDAGKMCDELVKESNDFGLFEELSGILTYFDRHDNTSSLLNNIAFTEKFDISEDAIRSLIGNKKQFDKLQERLFEKLFIQPLSSNKYLTAFGKKRIETLFKGLNKIINGDASIKDLLAALKKLTDEERVYRIVLRTLKERIRDIYPRLEDRAGKIEVRRELQSDLSKRNIITNIPEHIFEKVVIDVKKEAFYLNHVLPKVIKNRDIKTREDFLKNSGLDRFYIETLEREHLRNKGISYSIMEDIVAGGMSTA